MFTKLDFLSGFYQVFLDLASRKFTAFACDWGLFEYLVMLIGLCNSPATFQRPINSILEELIREGFVIVYMDHILIHSPKSHQETYRKEIENKTLKVRLGQIPRPHNLSQTNINRPRKNKSSSRFPNSTKIATTSWVLLDITANTLIFLPKSLNQYLNCWWQRSRKKFRKTSEQINNKNVIIEGNELAIDAFY